MAAPTPTSEQGRGEVHERKGDRHPGKGQRPDTVADENAVGDIVEGGGCHGNYGGDGVLHQQTPDILRAQLSGLFGLFHTVDLHLLFGSSQPGCGRRR